MINVALFALWLRSAVCRPQCPSWNWIWSRSGRSGGRGYERQPRPIREGESWDWSSAPHKPLIKSIWRWYALFHRHRRREPCLSRWRQKCTSVLCVLADRVQSRSGGAEEWAGPSAAVPDPADRGEGGSGGAGQTDDCRSTESARWEQVLSGGGKPDAERLGYTVQSVIYKHLHVTLCRRFYLEEFTLHSTLYAFVFIIIIISWSFPWESRALLYFLSYMNISHSFNWCFLQLCTVDVYV